jgi:hypothetical protein
MLLLLTICLMLVFAGNNTMAQHYWESLEKVEIYQPFEITLIQSNFYNDPLRDVELRIEFTHQFGKKVNHFGFWDGDSTWKIRFSPDETGIWNYRAWFTDNNPESEGAFGCIDNNKPGRVEKNKYNPFWLGKGDNPKDLFRSFHVGDRFFAYNWDDPNDPDDGNKRKEFLDWLQEMGYNMISVGSFFTNRDVDGRGRGWVTPEPWPLDPEEYRKMEYILDDLRDRDITVFPFAGIFGLAGKWPTEPAEQELYIKYLLARFGHYPNLILNIAGPEPAWRKEAGAYQGSMRMVDIRRLGEFIKRVDAHNLILTVHNEKGVTQYGDPFIDETWYDMTTLQGPTTTNLEILYNGLAMNHHRYKPAYAQETLWSGNIYHPDYTPEELRKNALTILFSGSILNFADNNGLSSTGFSGSCDLKDANIQNHLIIKDVWDWFETIPFHRMVNRQDLVKQGFCLATEGQEYYVYLDTISKVEIFYDFDYPFESRWINAAQPSEIRPAVASVSQAGFHTFESPAGGDDWILHVFAQVPNRVAEGNFPDIAIDSKGNVHIVYNRKGLKYRKFDVQTGRWSPEQDTGCKCEWIERSEPDIVIDSKDFPHVYCGRDYAWFDGRRWRVIRPGSVRDTEMAIDSYDNVYITHRGGNNGGNLGLLKRSAQTGQWSALPDPDLGSSGYNDHVYPDIYIDNKDHIHIIQRKGPEVEVTYRFSSDGGQSWSTENVKDRWDEAPHIVVDSNGTVYVTTGIGELFERGNSGTWNSIGRKVHARSRMRPELAADKKNNLYITSFGGRYNTRLKNVWMGEKRIDPLSSRETIGFVETAGCNGFVYIIWEEGEGNANDGLNDNADIFVGRLYPDGTIIGF